MNSWRMVLAGALLFSPVAVSAHTRWFAEGSLMPYTPAEPTALYLTILWSVAAIIVMVGIYFERHRILRLSFCEPKMPQAFERAAAVFVMIAGAFFVIAGTNGYMFSPNLTAAAGVPEPLFWGLAVVGALFVVGFMERVAALALIGLWLATGYFTNSLSILENVWVVSTALFAFVMGNDYFSLFGERTLKDLAVRFRAYAIPMLRMGTGATLFILGFSEKILHPEFGLNFLAQHDWNFMQLLGVDWYSDYLFVLSAGSVEALFGLVFMLGIATRLNALVIGIFFSIPIFILGPLELTGHLPHFAAVILILLFGCGNHWKIAYPMDGLGKKR